MCTCPFLLKLESSVTQTLLTLLTNGTRLKPISLTHTGISLSEQKQKTKTKQESAGCVCLCVCGGGRGVFKKNGWSEGCPSCCFSFRFFPFVTSLPAAFFLSVLTTFYRFLCRTVLLADQMSHFLSFCPISCPSVVCFFVFVFVLFCFVLPLFFLCKLIPYVFSFSCEPSVVFQWMYAHTRVCSLLLIVCVFVCLSVSVSLCLRGCVGAWVRLHVCVFAC